MIAPSGKHATTRRTCPRPLGLTLLASIGLQGNLGSEGGLHRLEASPGYRFAHPGYGITASTL